MKICGSLRLGLCVLASMTWTGVTVSQAAAPTTQAVQRMGELIGKGPADVRALLPDLMMQTPARLRETKLGKLVLDPARLQETPIPVTTYTDYRMYRKTGDRAPYEKTCFEKRRQLNRLVLVAWLSEKDDLIDGINDRIWNICEETNWVIPAHERRGEEIDLFAAETAAELAFVDLLLGDRLPKEIRERIRYETKRRVLDPYLDHGTQFWWDGGRNNWTGVCAGATGETLLILETDPARCAKGLATVLEQLDRFLDKAFEEDGASTEGIGYWNYGLLHYVIFAEMLRARTDGQIDLLAAEKFKKIAAYPSVVATGRHSFASFADSHEHGSVYPFLAAKLSERTGETSLLAQSTGDVSDRRLGAGVCTLLWCKDEPVPEPVLTNAVLEKAGIVRRVGRAAGKPLVLVAKAGNNAEQHNHNDVGSFVLRIGNTTYLCDPGSGLYDSTYFSKKRYENAFAGSYGHSVPRIGGEPQKPGAPYRGTLQIGEDGTVRIEMHEAYGLPDLKNLTRTIRVGDDGAVSFEDAHRFDGAGREVEEAFVTWLNVKVNGSTASILSKEGTLEIRADGAEFKAERLEEACKANRKKEILTRVTATYPATGEISARFVMTYKPAKKK